MSGGIAMKKIIGRCALGSLAFVWFRPRGRQIKGSYSQHFRIR